MAEIICGNYYKVSYRIKTFMCSQIKQIKCGGTAVLIQKISKLAISVIGVVLSIPAVLVVYMLRPFLCVRLFKLDTERIGNCTCQLKRYFYEQDAGEYLDRRFDVFYHGSNICNIQLYKMLIRELYVLPLPVFSWYFSFMVKLFNLLPGGKSHVIQFSGSDTTASAPTSGKQYLFFDDDEKKIAKEEFERIGIPLDAKYVCIYGRDSAYLKKKFPGQNWDYHNIRDNSIKAYIPAAERLAENGYFVIRMGHMVEEPLETANSKIIDYGSNGYRSDFLDIYLSGNCQFFLGVLGGLVGVPVLFQRPIGGVDVINLRDLYSCYHANGTYITKKIWLVGKKRLLTFKEIIDRRFSQQDLTRLLGGGTIEIINNTAEEIDALSVEMDLRASGRWKTTQEDMNLQERFKGLYRSQAIFKDHNIRIGAAFLRDNKELLK